MIMYGPAVIGHPLPEKTPYQKGFETGKDYWRNQKNPFDSKMWEHTRWEEGFKDGFKERKEPEPDPHAGYYGIWG